MMSAKIHDHIKPIASPNGTNAAETMPKLLQAPKWWERWFVPHEEVQMVNQLSTKGLFIPWPLMAIIVTLAVVLVSGLVTLEVQVSNLSTTILLRDADQRAEIAAIKEKNAQLEVYIHSDREKLVDIQTTLREADKNRQPQRRN
jgi:hypothetical protein